ncbi:MAG: asparaginase domain-containing protein [Desulfobacter sp.]
METISIIATGGTIDKIYFDAKSEYEVGPPNAIEVLNHFNLQVPYTITSLLRKDSLDLTDEDRELIAETVAADPCRMIIITHGTDTMPETARHIIAHGGAKDKTVVLTGALLPAMFSDTDAVFNIGCALGAVQKACPGVYIAMNGKIFMGGKVMKNRELGRFEEKF